jgi:hypothetical protein
VSVQEQQEQAPRCVNHPRVETWVSCAECGDPICPDCMVQGPVGNKCRKCARQPRSAMVRLKPDRAAKAIGTSLGLGVAFGVAVTAVVGTPLGLFGFLVAFFVGYVIGEAVKRASGYYREPAAGWIAAVGGVVALATPIVLYSHLYTGHLSQQAKLVELVLGAVAAYAAYRQAT